MTGPNRLVQALPDPAASSDIRTGVVTNVTARGITVAVANGAVSAAHLDSYAPAVGDTVALAKTQDTWLCMGRVVGSGTATDYRSPGSGIGPSIMDAMVTSGNGALANDNAGTPQAVTGYTVNFYHPPNHIVVIWAAFLWGGTVSGDWIIVDLTETISGSGVGEFVEPIVNATFGRSSHMTGTLSTNLGGAKRTVSMTMRRLTGTGTVSITKSATRPGFMIALDMGDASVFRVV